MVATVKDTGWTRFEVFQTGSMIVSDVVSRNDEQFIADEIAAKLKDANTKSYVVTGGYRIAVETDMESFTQAFSGVEIEDKGRLRRSVLEDTVWSAREKKGGAASFNGPAQTNVGIVSTGGLTEDEAIATQAQIHLKSPSYPNDVKAEVRDNGGEFTVVADNKMAFDAAFPGATCRPQGHEQDASRGPLFFGC